MAAPQPLQLSEHQLAALARPEGTLGFKLYWDRVPQLPDTGSAVLLELPAGDTESRLELDAEAVLRFVRGAPGGGVLSAEVPVGDMLDLPGWHIFLVWRPNRLTLHVGDLQRRRGLRSSR